MKEIKDIIEAFDAAELAGKKTALATIVQVNGSSYRRPGARMLVTEDGRLTGAISGGCLEGDALKKAVLAIAQGRKKLVIYDTTDEDDAKLGVQLGCNGIVSILFEPIDSTKPEHPIQLLRLYIAERKPFVLISGYSINHTEHTGTCTVQHLPEAVQKQLLPVAERVLYQQQSEHLLLDTADQQMYFLEFCMPSIALLIAGAGNDIMPLVDIACLLGWQVTIADGRASHATNQRFPGAARILLGKPEKWKETVKIDNRTAVILMTHNYNYDMEMLRLLGNHPELKYLGILGPAAKRDRMLEALKEEGITISAEGRDKIYGPTGLDLGAETAAEIAVSITSEIMAVLQSRQPVHLREKPTPIHQDHS